MFKKVIEVVMVCLLMFSCASSLKTVKKELWDGGFVMLYPAEEGIEPGQIWITNGHQKTIICTRPEALRIIGPSEAVFEKLTKDVKAKIGLDANFTNEILGKAGDLTALLKASHVKNIKLDFGKTTIKRIVTGDITAANTSPIYWKLFNKICSSDGPAVLITGTVETSGMTYTFTCNNALELQANQKQIAESTGLNFNVEIKNDTVAVWDIPTNKKLVIGIVPARGEFVLSEVRLMEMSTKDHSHGRSAEPIRYKMDELKTISKEDLEKYYEELMRENKVK